MLTSLELEEITGVARYETLGLAQAGASRLGKSNLLICRAVLHRHSASPPLAAGVRVREVSATDVELLCAEAAAPAEGERFTLGIERKGATAAGAGAGPSQALWVKCATVHRVATGWSGRCVLGARFIERTEAPKLPPLHVPTGSAGKPPAANRLVEMLFEQHPLAMAFVGVDHRFTRANRAFCTLTGYRADELAALTFVEITHPDDVGADLQQAARLFAGEIPSFQATKRYIDKAGGAVPVDLTASAVRDTGGKVVGAIATVRPLPRAAVNTDPERAHELERLRRAVLG